MKSAIHGWAERSAFVVFNSVGCFGNAQKRTGSLVRSRRVCPTRGFCASNAQADLISASTAPATVSTTACRLIRYSEKTLSAGVKAHKIEGIPVPIFTPAKTVADCFKYRNKVGLDVAIEALKDALKQRKATVDEIEGYARISRMSRIIRPYLEALG